MKKIFTLLAPCLFSVAAMGAEKAVSTVSIYNETTSKYETPFKDIEGEISKNADGNIELSNFINSGCPLTFTFDSTVELNKAVALELKGNLDAEDTYPYILDASGNYLTGRLVNATTDAPVAVYFPYVCTGVDYTYVMKIDKEKYGYDYYAWLTFSGFDKDNNYLDWYYMDFYFDMPTAPATPGKPGEPGGDDNKDVTIDVTVDSDGAYYYPDYNDYSNYSTKYFKSFDAQLVIAEDGTYTLKNIFNTEYSISYTVGDFTDQMAPVTYTGNITADEGYEDYPYFMVGTKYMTVNMIEDNDDASPLKVQYLAGDQDVKYTYVYKCTDEEIAKGYDEYYVYLCLNGYVGSTGYIDSYWSFGYNMPKSGDSAVTEIADDENAPVEFYNLQGVKVTNPSNGIFIRRQGNKTSKVAL